MSQAIERNSLQLAAPKAAPVTLSQFGLPQPALQNNAGGLGVPQLGTPAASTGADAGLLPESEVFLSQREISDLFGGGRFNKILNYRQGLLG